jgi:hypothetical protein
VKILEHIRRSLKHLNERFVAGTTGGTPRDVSMIEGIERQQFQADEDEDSE